MIIPDQRSQYRSVLIERQDFKDPRCSGPYPHCSAGIEVSICGAGCTRLLEEGKSAQPSHETVVPAVSRPVIVPSVRFLR